MSRARKQREVPDPQVILAILKSTISRWQELGGQFSILNLDPTRNALGIVLDGAYICLNCSEWFIRGPKHERNICKECQQKLNQT